MANDPDDSVVYLSVAVEGIDFAAQATYAEVEDNDRLIDRAAIVLDDPQGSITDVPREGQTLTVELGWASEHAVLFEGDIVRVVTESFGAAARRVTLVALDPAYRMMQGVPKTRDHTGSLSSIIQKIVGEYNIPVGQIELDPDPSFTDDAPLRQTNRKDWAFIQYLAERYRVRAFVEYNEGASKFYAVSETKIIQGDSLGTLAYTGGPGRIVEFRYQRVAGSAVPVSSAVTVDPATGDVVTAPASPASGSEPAPQPDPAKKDELNALSGSLADDYTKALDKAGTAKLKPESQRPTAIVAGVPSDPTLPDLVSKVDPTRALGLHGDGVTVGSVKLRAKGKLGIAGIANWAEGDWYVRQVNHVVTRENYWTRFVVTR